MVVRGAWHAAQPVLKCSSTNATYDELREVAWLFVVHGTQHNNRSSSVVVRMQHMMRSGRSPSCMVVSGAWHAAYHAIGNRFLSAVA